MEGDLRFKIDWASLIILFGSKFTVSALYLRPIFQVQAPARGRLIFGGAI